MVHISEGEWNAVKGSGREGVRGVWMLRLIRIRTVCESGLVELLFRLFANHRAVECKSVGRTFENSSYLINDVH